MNPALAPIFIHDLELVFIDAERKRLTFRCTRQMAEAVEANVRFFRDNFFDKHSRAGRYTTKPRESKNNNAR